MFLVPSKTHWMRLLLRPAALIAVTVVSSQSQNPPASGAAPVSPANATSSVRAETITDTKSFKYLVSKCSLHPSGSEDEQAEPARELASQLQKDLSYRDVQPSGETFEKTALACADKKSCDVVGLTLQVNLKTRQVLYNAWMNCGGKDDHLWENDRVCAPPKGVLDLRDFCWRNVAERRVLADVKAHDENKHSKKH